MPLYEYLCEACDNAFEVTQGFNDAPLKNCPKCGGEVKKLMSLGGFALRGNGWFSTDYKKNPNENKGTSSGS
ncbi:MAG: zinc ribbon domain-containing protein [Bdellovibrionales bacterium]|nr:zinc ribbon domain-containing protein [Bdellovibrionales bacterium]